MLIVDDNEIDRNIIANYFAEDFMIQIGRASCRERV